MSLLIEQDRIAASEIVHALYNNPECTQRLQVEAGAMIQNLLNTIRATEQQLTAEREAREKAEQRVKDDFEAFHDTRMKVSEACGDPYLLHDDAVDLIIQRMKSAEQRIREAQEQEPVFTRKHPSGDFMQSLYAAPIPPADVAELQRHNTGLLHELRIADERIAELTRKLAEQQALAEALDDALDKFGEHKDGCTFAEPLPTGIGTWGCNCGLDNAKFGISGREELTKLLEEAKRQAVPEVTDNMALAFHHALTDDAIGAHEIEELKIGLRAAVLSAAPQPEGADK